MYRYSSPQIAAIGIEVRVLQRREVVVVKEPVSRGYEVVKGTIFAWQGAHAALRCSVVNCLILMILGFWGGSSFGAAFISRLCSSEGPWHVSQLMPGSAQTVR